MVAKRKWWHLGHPSKGLARIAFSGMDEIFHGTAKHAQEIREEQSRQVVRLDSEGKPFEVRIKPESKE